MLYRMLALWALLLTAVVCCLFLPLSRLVAGVLFLSVMLLVVGGLLIVHRRTRPSNSLLPGELPEAHYRQPVILVCGDQPQPWPENQRLMVTAQGCWLQVSEEQDLLLTVRQLLAQRPGWGDQLSVMFTLCPQQHSTTDALVRHLYTLRWKVDRLRRKTSCPLPLTLCFQTGTTMVSEAVWQIATTDKGVSLWRQSATTSTLASQADAFSHQLIINSLKAWADRYVMPCLLGDDQGTSPVSPEIILWGATPAMANVVAGSLWHHWLQQHTALQTVSGWLPAGNGTEPTSVTTLPDFILALLPGGRGVTPRKLAVRYALNLALIALLIALCSSGWNNRALIRQVIFDLRQYEAIPPTSYEAKARAVEILNEDATRLGHYARDGEPLGLSLGLYQGERLRSLVLEALSSYIPPQAPPPPPEAVSTPQTVRLDSMSLFDSGKYVLKAGSTKSLINALTGIKVRPGWLVLITGHTDSSGNPQRNRELSLKRAEAVRDWMREYGELPASCFIVEGQGDSRPVAINDTAEGRAQNRRVEITLMPQAGVCASPEE